MNWRHAPHQYGAIHFHDDDMIVRGGDRLQLHGAARLKSGCYAAMLDAAGRSSGNSSCPKGARQPTCLSRLERHLRCNSIGRMRSVMTKRPGPAHRGGHNRHPVLEHPSWDFPPTTGIDGGGICYSSRLRPAANIHPTGRCRLRRLFIVDWLERSGLPDVITDDDLHAEGLDLLRPYRVLVTGSHRNTDHCR